MLDIIHSILEYNWRDQDYTIFVRYPFGTAYVPSPMDKVTYYFFAAAVPKPETSFFVDIKPEVAYERIMQRINDTREMFEKPQSLRNSVHQKKQKSDIST
jgi:thymidylate kinase